MVPRLDVDDSGCRMKGARGALYIRIFDFEDGQCIRRISLTLQKAAPLEWYNVTPGGIRYFAFCYGLSEWIGLFCSGLMKRLKGQPLPFLTSIKSSAKAYQGTALIAL